jgi:hypothetical protein
MKTAQSRKTEREKKKFLEFGENLFYNMIMRVMIAVTMRQRRNYHEV